MLHRSFPLSALLLSLATGSFAQATTPVIAPEPSVEAPGQPARLVNGFARLDFRKEPYGKRAGTLTRDTPFFVVGRAGRWYKIRAFHHTGYVEARYVTIEAPTTRLASVPR